MEDVDVQEKQVKDEKSPVVETSAAEVKEEQREADEDGDVFYESVDYTSKELERLIAEATEYKKKGNECFAHGDYEKAIQEYEQALTVCPVASLTSKQQSKYTDARDMATSALELDPSYTKVILRRAQANEKLGSYTSLSDALKDYEQLSEQVKLDNYTKRECARAKQQLPGLIKEQMEKEKDEMMGKLKDLGNTLLGKFGLSTDNFQLQQNPGSGGYSVNFVNK
ncbi:hypothetical protein BDB00DRAFT_772717 [Zychaea mexicana]|uniref:uncharacterized protein n=1 Tax=Zychaea mexicana TaxID=64656 RepID=UPI0022FEE021|nr:uncharacterized protein BDB00DRAFT_772717 [Zychaea mexicana]KAI9488301.1 hypothetical protein BDB00DRAFT_772717 [Zychaea mexicana]